VTQGGAELPPGVMEEVQRRLAAIEAEHEVRIVYACESGSRAWGFPSTNSDFDVRFIYARRAQDYLSVFGRRDVIELATDGVWDINGWDLKKALALFYKSNPALLEWLRSPIVYREVSSVAAQLRAHMPRAFSRRAAMHHYLSMAHSNAKHCLRGPEVQLKKYFYALRPLLACRWLEANEGVVPMQFETLLEATTNNKSVLKAVHKLLQRKRQAEELDLGPSIPVLDDFLEDELQRLQSIDKGLPVGRMTHDEIDELFRALVDEAWSGQAG